MTLETRGTGRIRVGAADTTRESPERHGMRLLGLRVLDEAFEAAFPSVHYARLDKNNRVLRDQERARLFLASGFYHPYDEAAGIDATEILARYRRLIAAESPQVGG